eukprot:COSAG06_NODE_5144_length_3683_cov_2.517299_4_plen_84_part_00
MHVPFALAQTGTKLSQVSTLKSPPEGQRNATLDSLWLFVDWVRQYSKSNGSMNIIYSPWLAGSGTTRPGVGLSGVTTFIHKQN